jgi:predicted membrane protein
MENRHRSNRYSQLFYGLLIVAVGVIFLLDNLEIVEAHKIFRFWPTLFIIFGSFRIVGSASPKGKIFGLFFVTIGVLLLLDRMEIINVGFWEWWPLILVFIGINILLKRSRSPEAAATGGVVSDQQVPGDADAIVDMSCFLSGNKRACVSQDFRGGDLTSVMGGCELDLRRASIKNSPATITIFSVWGGISIRVPPDWKVSLQATPFLGGIDDKTNLVPGTVEKLLLIKGEVIMAGAEITN